MRHGLIVRMIASVLLGLAAAPARAADKGPAGTWYGPLSAGPIELRLGVVIAAEPDGTLSGVLDSLDQGASDIPMDEVTVRDKAVAFAIRPLGIVFEGMLSADSQSIQGEFKQSGATIPLTLRRTEKRVENIRPQHPKRPYPYVEEASVDPRNQRCDPQIPAARQ